MTLLRDRLKMAREAKGMSQTELGRAIGKSQSTIGALESGRNKETTSIASLASVLGVSAIWLETGKGEMEPAQVPFDRNVRLADMGSRPIPVISSIQAGRMTYIIDIYEPGDADEWLLTDAKVSENAFALVIEGESMLPEFHSGDKVIIDPLVHPRPGEFVAAKNGDEESTFKKYRARGVDADGNEIFELVPLNPDFPTLRSDQVPLMIIGTMIEHRRYRRGK